MAQFKLIYEDGPECGYKLVGSGTGLEFGFHRVKPCAQNLDASSPLKIVFLASARTSAEMQWHLMEHDKGVKAAVTHTRNWRNFSRVENDPLNAYWEKLVDGESIA